MSNLELHTLVKLKLALTEEAGFLAPFNIGSTNIRVCSLLFVMKILCAPPKIFDELLLDKGSFNDPMNFIHKQECSVSEKERGKRGFGLFAPLPL